MDDISDLIKKIPLFRNKYDKSNIRVLFVDDEYDQFSVIQNLIGARWSVTGIKDIQNVEEDIVKCSQIIFVDYKGVGKKLSRNEQGIALIKLLKKTYKKTKRVILYSGHDRFTLGDDFGAADDWLPKNSDTREFIDKINENIKLLR